MPNRPPLPPPPLDPAPLKDMARLLHFAARQGGRSLRRGLPPGTLPEPAIRLADAAFASAERLGKEARRGASALGRAVLGEDAPPPPLSHPEEAAAAARFAAAAHDGLRIALAHLGAESCLVSEAAAQSAWRQATQDSAGQSDSATAAALFAALLAVQAVRETVWTEGGPQPAGAPRLAVYATLLAMLAEPAGFRDLIPAATDIALALQGELAVAQPAALQAMFDEFRAHV